MSESSENWSVVVRSQERVLTGLERGECDGILGDEWLEPDDLVQSALDEGFLDWFEDFPDRRRRRSIDKRLFCRVLLCGRLVDLPSVAETGRVIFHATTLLDKLGFNFRVMREGGSRTGDERPFDEEALEDYFAKLTAEDYFSHQLTLSRRLLARPELAGKVWLLDCRDTKVPNGHHQEGRHWKAGVLSVCGKAGPHPVLWNFGLAPQTADLVLARSLVKAALEAWGQGAIRWLILDAGFVDGPWLHKLKGRSVDCIIRIKQGMDNYEAAVRAALAEAGVNLELVYNRAALMLLPAGISKGTGVQHLVRAFGLSFHDVLALGDSENDGALFEACGWAGCPANAVPEVMQRADWIFPGDDGAGNARAIVGPILNGLLPLDGSPRQRIDLAPFHFQNIERQSVGGLPADSGKPGKLFSKLFNRFCGVEHRSIVNSES